jgi:peptidoglycan/LPS O-acetylase OafA/YrhL
LYHITEVGLLTVIFPAIGVMFAIGGSLTARSLARAGQGSEASAFRATTAVVISRFRRLLPSVWVFAALALVASIWLGLGSGQGLLDQVGLLWWVLPLAAPTRFGSDEAWVFTGAVWYLTAYLWFVLLSPMLLRLLQAWPRSTLLAGLALPVVLHLQLLTVGGPFQSQAYDLTQYAACWLVGMAHREGWLARLSYAVLWPVLGVFGAATVASLVASGQTLDTVDLHQLPVVNGLWSAVFAAAVLRLAPSSERNSALLSWAITHDGVTSTVRVLNARALTIYLWHYPCLLLARWLTGFDSAAGPWLWPTGALAVVFTAAAVVAVGWVEDVAARRPAWPRSPRLRRSDGQDKSADVAGDGSRPS